MIDDSDNLFAVSDENEQGAVVPLEDGALRAMIQGEIDTQIATARQFPRDVRRALRTARDMVVITQEVAGECYYRLERRSRDGQRTVIQGPSARFAEILASAWGNCRVGARIIEEGERFVAAQGAFADLESNTAITYEVRRRITDRHGRRYSDDMVAVTANAACAIALRNAILKGIPQALWKPVLEEAIRTYRGDAESLVERRAKMLEAFAKLGVTEAQILRHLEKASVEAIGLDDLVGLRGLFTALRDGETTIEETFPEPEPPQGAAGATKTEHVKERLKRTRKEQASSRLLAEYLSGIAEAKNEDELRYYSEIARQSGVLSVEEKAQVDEHIALRRQALETEGQLFK